jgi:MazG family protein
MQKITVVSLGQADESQLTLGALNALKAGKKVILRTERHGAVPYLKSQGIPFSSLDAFYEQSFDFDELNDKIVTHLLSQGDFTYAVSDSAGDATVEALFKTGAAHIDLLPGVSASADFFSSAKQAVPPALRILSAIDCTKSLLNPREALLITELNSAVLTSEVKLYLLALYEPEMQVLLKTKNAVKALPLFELDRQSHYDHQSAVFLPAAGMLSRSRQDFADLLDVMSILTGDDGCPWDKEQTHDTLKQYLIEEAYETVAAIDQGDMAHVYDELGDVLLQVVFHALIAKAHGEFDIYDVTSAIVNKMISRHRHIFGADECKTADDVLDNWEKIKKAEKGIQSYTGLMQDIPPSLPALMRASKVQNKAKQVGFDFENASEALKKVFEEAKELSENLEKGQDPDEEMGDLLFSCVNVARKLKIQPEICLQSATEKFINRFSRMENEILLAEKSLEGLTLSEMDVYWERGKVHRP